MDYSPIISASIGLVAGILVSYFVFLRKSSISLKMKIRDESGGIRTVQVPQNVLERKKREMRTLMVERDMLSSALMKIYQAESDGLITSEDREIIAKRYSDQIKEIDAKLKDAELYVEVGELEKLREEIVSLFQEKIRNIESRLEDAKRRLGLPKIVEEKSEIKNIELEEDLERIVQKKNRQAPSESEKKVIELRNEIMQALSRLEQIDIEKKEEN